MTFSDSRVVAAIKKDFRPVWESVSPIRKVTFELGEGRKVKGAVTGEIALYFCTPEGKVFDILPGLQSPAATLKAIEEAKALYEAIVGDGTDALVGFHEGRMKQISLAASAAELSRAKHSLDEREERIEDAADEATRDLRLMSLSKVLVVEPEPILVVEPGAKGYYSYRISERFVETYQKVRLLDLSQPGLSSLLKSPADWKRELFEEILRMPLEGGEIEYGAHSLEAVRILEE